jgi:hypothetical protein
VVLEARDDGAGGDTGAEALERPFDERGHAPADHLAHCRLRQRGEAELCKAARQCVRDLAGGIGQRAVEVEDDRADRQHGLSRRTSPARARSTGR